MREMTPFDTLCLHKCDTNMADSNRRQAVSHVSENQELFFYLFKRSKKIETLHFRFNLPHPTRYVQKCTQQQKWQKWQNFANNNLEANANEKTRGPPCKAGEFGESGKNGETGKTGKLVKIANNNLEANANEKTRGPPCKAGEFGEAGKNGKLFKIADNNLEANTNEKIRGPPCKAGDFGEFDESGKMANWSKSPTTT